MINLATRIDVKHLLIALCFLISSCAQVVLSTPAKQSEARDLKPDKDVATLYIIRDQTLMFRAAALPVAVEGKVVAWLGPASYTMLRLQPGTTQISSPELINTWDIYIGESQSLFQRLEAGRLYYVRVSAGLGGKINWDVKISEPDAIAAIKNHDLVAYDHRGLQLKYLWGYASNSVALRKNNEKQPSPRLASWAQPSKATGHTELPPSIEKSPIAASKISNESIFVAIMGALFLTTLAFGAAANAIPSSPPDTPYLAPQTESRVIEPLSTRRGALGLRYSSTMQPIGTRLGDYNNSTRDVPALIELTSPSGATFSLQGNKVRNIQTGVSWTVNGNIISGSDGSYFRDSGGFIYSSDGRYFTRIGNRIISADGRSCTLIGNSYSCN